MVNEGILTEEEALSKVDPRQLDQLLHPTFDPNVIKSAKALGKGLPASPGAGAGKVVFSADEAVKLAATGERVILVRRETSPEDILGMNVSQGILTARGGMTSHAAVVARGMGTCCVSGCEDIKMNEEAKTFELGGRTFKKGDFISLDGTTGLIYGEDIPTVRVEISGSFRQFISWADKVRTLEIRTNADTTKDAQTALELGAEGIGLTRTEHMFFEADRLPHVRKMILAENEADRRKALDALLPMQKAISKASTK
jgi:pyruvate,orthophosphate dikinase